MFYARLIVVHQLRMFAGAWGYLRRPFKLEEEIR